MRKSALLLAALLLPAGRPALADDTEDRASEAIQKLGGKVVRDNKDPAQPVVEVDLNGTKATDADLKIMANLSALKTLKLQKTRVTDAGLKSLAPLKGLQTLNLAETRVTDRGLKGLAELEGLQLLDLTRTPVTGRGLKDLAVLAGLQKLYLNDTKVTDATLKEVEALKGLQELALFACTGVTKAGAAALQKALPDCKVLR